MVILYIDETIMQGDFFFLIPESASENMDFYMQEHFFASSGGQSGYIQGKLKNIRRNLPSTSKQKSNLTRGFPTHSPSSHAGPQRMQTYLSYLKQTQKSVRATVGMQQEVRTKFQS